MMQKTKRKRDKISSPGRGWRPALVNLIALACLLGAAAAGSAQEAPEAGGTAAAARAVPQVASVSEALEDESFHYDPAGRRDPFKSLLDLQSKAKDVSMLPPIQQLDLNEINIIGVILDEVEGPRVMVKAPNGQTFIVKKGMIVGKNEGEVIEVTLQGVRVVEKFVDYVGQETLKETFIKTRSAGK
jgi:type IV pilus assembly protein PilP